MPWNELAFIDAKCGAQHAAAEALCDEIAGRDQLAKVERCAEQAEALGGRIAQIFGTGSPESSAVQSLWIMLRHDASVMRRQIVDSPTSDL